MVRRTCHAAVMVLAGLTFVDDNGLLRHRPILNPRKK